jgi:hypothetical protein
MFNHLKINKMKKFFGVIGVAAFAVVVALSVNASLNRNATFDVTLANVEALSSCEITRGNNTVFSCIGDTGTCSDSSWGYTLTCSGQHN